MKTTLIVGAVIITAVLLFGFSSLAGEKEGVMEMPKEIMNDEMGQFEGGNICRWVLLVYGI